LVCLFYFTSITTAAPAVRTTASPRDVIPAAVARPLAPAARDAAPVAAPAAPVDAPPQAAAIQVQDPNAPMPLFGPAEYVRTSGRPNVYSAEVVVPPWIVAPFTLEIQNGMTDGSARLSSSTIAVNGAAVVRNSDFNQQVGVIERTIALGPANSLTFTLAGAPQARMVVNVFGTNGDHSPPQLAILSPAVDAHINTPASSVAIRYADLVGDGEPAASGVVPATLAVSVDGVDRTGLFTHEGGEASATLTLPEGAHTIEARIADAAGNVRTVAAPFRIDLTAPTIRVAAPALNGYVPVATPAIRVEYEDETALNLDTIEVLINGTDRTALFTRSASSATATLPSEAALADGPVWVSVRIRDRAGNEGSATSTFIVDTTAPQVTIVEPADNQYTSLNAIDVSGGVADASPFTVRVEGVDATVTGTSFKATGVTVGAGPEATLRVVATDAAGHTGEATVRVRIDRDPPVLALTGPTAGAFLRGPVLEVIGTVTDASATVVMVNGETMATSDGTFAGSIAAVDGPLSITATAVDAAGNRAVAERSVTVDSLPPGVTITEPVTGLITRAAQVRVTGIVTDASAVTVRIGGADVPVVDGSFATDHALPTEGANAILVSATDAAGNETTVDLSVISDRTSPELTIVTPAVDALVANLPVNVQGSVTDLTAVTIVAGGVEANVSGAGWTAAIGGLPDGNRTITVVATDAAGNQTTRTRSFLLDTAAPVVTIESPQAGALTRLDTATVTGTVVDLSTDSVVVAGITAVLGPEDGAGRRSFTATVPLGEGDNHVIAVATDRAGRAGQAEVHLTRDSTPPSVDLAAPERITRRLGGEAVVMASDNLGLANVVVTVNGLPMATFTQAPFEAAIVIPADAKPGDLLLLRAVATDHAGNTADATRQVRLAADGVLIGQVLSDVTGRPLAKATVTYGGTISSPEPAVTDDTGRYSFATGDTSARVTASSPGMTSVEREVPITAETGTVALDARLTPLAAAVDVGSDGQALSAGSSARPFRITVPSGSAGTYRLTELSGQGLPSLLPLGWSPLLAFDLRGAEHVQGPLALDASGLPELPLYLAQHTADGWRLSSGLPDLGSSGEVNIPLAPLTPVTPGAALVFAIVSPDDGVVVPAAAGVLTASEMAPISLAATSAGSVDPPTISPTGGTARGTLTIDSPEPLPSGTVVQAVVTETFNLTSGDVASEERRTQDLILYRQGGQLTATFPIVPSRTFSVSELASGTVHLDILAGRESVRGVTGGSEPVILTSGSATLSVGRGALPEDTAITFQSVVLSSFLPASAELTPIAEFSIDFAGRTLGLGAELSVVASDVEPYVADSDTLLIARVDRVSGVPRMVVVALAAVLNDRVVSQSYAGMAGVTRGGHYVLYRAAVPVGFVAGVATAAGSPTAALVSTASLPFIGVSDSDGRYIVATRTGTIELAARVTGTSLAAEASADVSARETTAVDFALEGEITTATVTPGDGAVAVSPGVQVEIATGTALNPGSLTPENIQLLHLGPPEADPAAAGTPVAVRLVLSASARTLALIPQARLAADARFRVQVSGLADIYGGAVVVPQATFVTKADAAPVYDVEKLVVSFPDQDGFATLRGPAGTLPPGSQVLVINHGSGEVSTFPVFNDGGTEGRFFAALTDRLQITITDTFGNVTTFARNTYVDDDGTTSVNAGGGIIEGPTGAEVRVPEGALNQFDVALMKLSALPQFIIGEFQKAGLPGLVIAGGVTIESPGLNFFTQEVDLAFPKPPDAPDGAIYFILRKLTGPDGRIAYESLDYGVVEGEGADAKVVTASDPFSGYLSDMNSFGLNGMDPSGAVGGQVMNHAIMAWAVDQALPGRPIGGVVTGKVLRTVWKPGAPLPEYEPVANALVSGVDVQGNPLFAKAPDGGAPPVVAVSQADGTYALFDQHYTGGPVTVSATSPGGGTVTGIAYEANPQDTKSPGLRFARHIATANLTYAAVQPPQGPTATEITLTRTVDGEEQPVLDGVVVTGTPVGARFRITADDPSKTRLLGAAINGESLPVQPDDEAQGRWSVGATYTPAQPGVYTLVVTAQPPIGAAVTSTSTFRAIAPGGGVSEPLPDDPPAVIDARTAPKPDAVGVAITVFPQVTFTEPVTNVPVGVSLVDASGASVPFALLGIGPDGPVTDVQAATPITSLTVQPLLGLKYGTRYTLQLTSDITDLDEAPDGTRARKALTPYATSFTTFAPEGIGQTAEQFTSGGLAIVGDRAYVAQNEGRSTRLRLFDVGDPVEPVEIVGADAGTFQLHRPPPVHVVGNPVDLAVEDFSEVVDGGRLMAVATNPYTYPYHPANVRLYDVTDDQQWHWVGAITLGKEPIDGMIRRIVLRGTRLYALVNGQGKGVHVIDLPTARGLFEAKTGGEEGAGFYEILQSIGTEGRGFGETSIVQSVFIETGTGLNSLMHDLAVTDLTIGGVAQPIAVATGRSPIAVVNPQTGAVLYNGPILDGSGVSLTSWGNAIEAGVVNGRPIALISAARSTGGTDHIFIVVDLTEPANPLAIGTLSLPGNSPGVNDILLSGTTAYVGTELGTYVVSLADETQPRLISTLTTVGGRLVLSDDNLLFGTVRSPGFLLHELGGVRSAALDTIAVVRKVVGSPIVSHDGKLVSARDVLVEFTLLPTGDQISAAEVEILRNGTVAETLTTTFTGSAGAARWPAGREIDESASYAVRAIVHVNPTYQTPAKPIPLRRPVDVQVQALGEEVGPSPNELSPGANVAVNDDDDDGDRVPDFAQNGAVSREDDLIPITLRVSREVLEAGTVTFSVPAGGDKVRVWTDRSKSTLLATSLPRAFAVPGDLVPSTVYLEGVKASDAIGDVTLRLAYSGPRSESYADEVRVTIVQVDLDIDSDNTNGLALPDRTPDEDRIEDVANDPRVQGKYVVANINDDDRDDIPDFADGFNRDPGPKSIDDDVTAGERFVPLRLTLSAGIDPSIARLRFTYTASDPNGVTMQGIVPEIQYVPSAGRLRIWTKDGLAPRRATSVSAATAGDFVRSGEVLEPARIGITTESLTATLYLEAVDASAVLADQRILVEVDPDGSGPRGFMASDAVRTTAVKVDLRDAGDSNREIIGGYIAWIAADPDPAMPQLRVKVVPDLGNSIAAAWSMRTEYTDHGRNDVVLVPAAPQGGAQTPVSLLINQEWNLAAAIAALPKEELVFGGKAVVKLRAGTAFEYEHQFRIRGRNPSDLVARAYVDNHASPQDQWFAYAIAKHESRDGEEFYHQFYRLGSTYVKNEQTGLPFFRPTPAGWGMMQMDFSSGPAGRPTIAEIWNWQMNVQSGIAKLNSSRAQATRWMQSLAPGRTRTLPVGQRPQSQVEGGGGRYVLDPNGDGRFDDATVIGGAEIRVPDEIVGNCAFVDGTAHRIEDAVTIKAYNSASRHYVYWDSTNRAWGFVRTNVRNFNYVARVCAEVER
jgi:hypothetical protein